MNVVADSAVFASSPKEFFARIASSAQPSLSYSEEFLWWSARLAGDATFNVRVVLRLSGPLRVAALQDSIVEIARRHETLRTVFPMEKGVVLRRLIPAASMRPAVVDVEGLDAANRDAESWRLVLDEANRPFNVTRGPLFRSRILRAGPDDHLLQFTIHHLVVDGQSVDILLRELGALYGAYCEHKASPLPELPLQYAAHAAVGRRRLQGAALDRVLSYWRAQLAGAPSLLDLPTDGPRRAARHYPGRTLTFGFSADQTRAVSRLAREHRTTLFVVLLGILDILLYRLSGTACVVVETPLGNRRSVGAEDLIGLLVDLVPLRTTLAGSPRLPDLLSEVRRTTLGAFDHAGVPIHVLVDALDAHVDPSHSAVCQVMFNLIDRRQRAVHLASLEAEQLPLPDSPHSKFDLMLTAHLTDALQFQLLYRCDLFSEVRMQEFVEQFRTLVDQVLASPEKRIDEYSLVTPRAAGVLPRVTTRAEVTCDRAIQERVRLHAQAAPGRVAVDDGRREVSYAELDACSDGVLAAIAHIAGESATSVDHDALSTFAQWATETFSIAPGARVGVLPGPGADGVLQGIFTALWSGGTVCFPPACDNTPDGLRDWLAGGIAVAFGEPTTWRRLNRNGGALPLLRHAFFAGRVLVREDVERVRALAPGVACASFFGSDRLPHHYACYHVPSDTSELRAIVPVGRGIPGVDLVVLNGDRRLAGIGELGELYLGGGRSGEPSARDDDGLVATGLTGRFLPDGNVDCVGDRTHVGSVDGYTLRFDEIASALMRHPDVLDATIVLEAGAAKTELVAYVVSHEERPWSADVLDRFVSGHLPTYMVPRRFVRVPWRGAPTCQAQPPLWSTLQPGTPLTLRLPRRTADGAIWSVRLK